MNDVAEFVQAVTVVVVTVIVMSMTPSDLAVARCISPILSDLYCTV